MKPVVFFIFFSSLFPCISGQYAGYLTNQNTPDKNKSYLSSENRYQGTANLSVPVNDPKVGRIIFPNAFRWNHSGPTDGYVNDNYGDDYIFKPVFQNVADYKIQIFSRRGLMVFESTNILRGWDGYLNDGNLAMQGVFIWKVKGKFTDGTFFDKAGDVTFIY